MGPSSARRWPDAPGCGERETLTEAAATILDDLGIPAHARRYASDEQKLVDEQFPEAKPEDCQIRYANPGRVAPPMTLEMNPFDQSAHTWLSGAEFPCDLGNSLVSAIERVAQQIKNMNADELESYGDAEFTKLERAYGGEDKLQEKLRAAAVMIDALDKNQPELKNLLRSKGIGDTALVVAQILG